MKLPGGKNAVSDYCLNPTHPRGRCKDRVFAATLGFAVADADVSSHALLNATLEGEAAEGKRDDYGQRYVLDIELNGPKGKATLRSSWIILHKEGIRRMTSCCVL